MTNVAVVNCGLVGAPTVLRPPTDDELAQRTLDLEAAVELDAAQELVAAAPSQEDLIATALDNLPADRPLMKSDLTQVIAALRGQ